MHILNYDSTIRISGGNPTYIAVGVGVATYVGTATLVDSTKTLIEFGKNAGEYLFNVTHPDQFGQMIYTESDFK